MTQAGTIQAGTIQAGTTQAGKIHGGVDEGGASRSLPDEAGTRRPGQAAAEAQSAAMRRGGEAFEQGSHGAAELARSSATFGRRGGEALANATRQGLHAATGSHERLLQHAAEEMERTGHRLAEVAQETAEGLRSLFALPAFSAEGVRQTQHAVTRLLDGVMTTHVRLTQEWLRRSGPSSLVELQRRYVRECFDALAEGGTQMLRVSRQAAEDSLSPLEDQLRHRREAAAHAREAAAWSGEDALARHPPEDAARARREDGAPVAEVMSRDVRLASPEDTVQQVARIMGEEDTGIVPVGEGDRLVGMVTDRDLAVRLVAAGRDPARTRVREVMSPEVRYVFEDEPVRHVSDVMAEQQLHRLPVLNRQKRLVGIVSVGDIARRHGDAAGQAMHGIARPGGPHAQRLR